MSEFGAGDGYRWYRSLNWTQWKALIASNLGWTFDGFEVFALILTVGAALHQLLDASEYRLIPVYAGAIIAITVFGWGAGGLLGGILADYIGRKRSMTLTILAYSALTGLSALSWNWWSFALFRFLVGLAIGSEWATGASITAELWPDHARGKGGAFLQSGYPIGSILASGVWVAIGTLGPDAWRYMYLVGVLPDPAQHSGIAALGAIEQAAARRVRSQAAGRCAARRRRGDRPLYAR
jgi:MFS family permease